jgi:SET domain-containing protein
MLYEIKSSPIHGMGVFATMDLQVNTNIGLGMWKEYISEESNDHSIKRNDLCTYMNHSDNPNVYYKKDTFGNYYFYAKHSIKKGEELLIDYNAFDFDGKKIFSIKRLKKSFY